jgi:hypothetical protein
MEIYAYCTVFGGDCTLKRCKMYSECLRYGTIVFRDGKNRMDELNRFGDTGV